MKLKLKMKKQKAVRKPCIGDCGRLVLVSVPGGGECRKCRRRRLHAGLKRLHKLGLKPNREISRDSSPTLDPAGKQS